MATNPIIVKARHIGNSVGFILPKEAVAHLNLKAGDEFFLTETQGGYQLSAYDPQFERELRLAAEGMEQYKNALRELAK